MRGWHPHSLGKGARGPGLRHGGAEGKGARVSHSHPQKGKQAFPRSRRGRRECPGLIIWHFSATAIGFPFLSGLACFPKRTRTWRGWVSAKLRTYSWDSWGQEERDMCPVYWGHVPHQQIGRRARPLLPEWCCLPPVAPTQCSPNTELGAPSVDASVYYAKSAKQKAQLKTEI